MGYFIDGREQSLIIWIPARGGSKGVPRKALQNLGGKPLIAYTIESALGIPGVDKVVVNTDDPEIQAVAVEYGAEAPFLRPKELAQDDSDLLDAYLYQCDWYSKHEGFVHDLHVGMSPTNPFRRKNLIGDALVRASEDDEIFNVRSVIPVRTGAYNFWIKDNQTVRRYDGCSSIDPVPDLVYENSFSFNLVIDSRNHLADKRITPCAINDIESIDIDELIDLEMARIVVSEGWYPFNE